jgi:lysophospholipase L1-like esterase
LRGLLAFPRTARSQFLSGDTVAMRLFCVIISVAMMLAAWSCHAQPPSGNTPAIRLATMPLPRLQDGRPLEWFMKRHEKHVAIAEKGGVDVLFIGDSITEGWAMAGREVWNREFAPLKSANFGISGDSTENVLWRLMNGEIGGAMRPKVVVLMIGTNNTGYRMDSPEDIAAGVGAILRQLKEKCPFARVLLLGIFPRGETPNAADRNRVKYIDVGKAFLDKDGVLSRDFMPDLLHLSPAAYALWAREIAPEVRAALAKPLSH